MHLLPFWSKRTAFMSLFSHAKPDVHICQYLASGAERARTTLQQRSLLYFVQSYSCNCASDHLYIVFYTTIKPINCLDLTLSREMVVFCATKHRIHSQFMLLRCIKCNVGPQVPPRRPFVTLFTALSPDPHHRSPITQPNKQKKLAAPALFISNLYFQTKAPLVYARSPPEYS